jgi:predicted transcriptional regulator
MIDIFNRPITLPVEMTAPQQDLLTIRSDAEWSAINSPVRVEMLVFMLTAGPCAIRDLSSLMNRPADGLYHHMRKLVSSGIVREVGIRSVGTQTETIYQTAAKDVTIDRNISRKRTRDRSIRLFRTMMQHALRVVEAAIETQRAVLEGAQQNFRLNWQVSWLDDRQLAEVKEHQEAITCILQKGMQQKQGQLVAHLTYMVPVVRTREARSPHHSESTP